jgi:TonB family protein
MVARALSRTRPAGLGTAGDVRIAFTVAPDGAPARLRIVEARGPERLSAAALAAVRRTRFAPPPAGMSERQRTFEVPYRFR